VPVAEAVNVGLLPAGITGGELLDAVVVAVGHVEVARTVHGDAGGSAQSAARAVPTSANGGQIGAGSVKDLDAVVPRIGHIEASGAVHRNLQRV